MLGWRALRTGAERDEGAGTEQNRHRFAAPRQSGTHECARPTGERQEHLDAIISFTVAGQRRRLFRGLDIFNNKWGIGDLPEEGRFLLNTQLMFLKKEKDPTTKLFDDDDWIRSLTEAQEISADIPEENVTFDQQAIHPKSPSHSDGRNLT